MEIVTRALDERLDVIVVSGTADRAAGSALRDAIDRVLASPKSKVIVDLTDATFLDSATLGTIAAAYQRDGRPGRVALVCPPGHVRDMFTMTALDTLLPIHIALEDARAGLDRD